MSNYRRRFSPGGTYFFSVMLAQGQDLSLIDNLGLLRTAYAKTMSENPFETLAIVVLPDHLHAIWRLPDGDANFPLRWRKIKSRFSHALGSAGTDRASHRHKAELGLWQRRYWEHEIVNEADLKKHMAYCWSDPVRHGLVGQATDWEASSIHREIRAGRITPDWSADRIKGLFGERGEPHYDEVLIEPA